MIKDGQTLIIGGLISEARVNAKKGIPFLGDIPVLDLIFGKKEGRLERTELLIFVTPHIIKSPDFKRGAEELAKFNNDSGNFDKPLSESAFEKKKKKVSVKIDNATPVKD